MSMNNNTRIMSSPKKIDATDDMDEWYFVVPGEAEPAGVKWDEKEEDEEWEVMKDEEKEEAQEEDEDDEEEEEEVEEEDGAEDNLWIVSEYSGTKLGSSSRDGNHHKFRLEQLGKKSESKDIKILVKDHVLPFLPAKSLIRFRAVSREWDRWIQSLFLAHQQSYLFQGLSGYFFQHKEKNIEFLTMNPLAYGVPSPSLSFLPEFVIIKSSSNGLVLCQDQHGDNTYYICNPVNKEWKKLPRPHFYHRYDTSVVLVFEPCVFNMDASYQLICPVTFIHQPMICFEVYSSSTKSWTESKTVCLELEEGSTLKNNGFYIKGTAYWETSSGKVLAFNPTNEIHEIITLPAYCPKGGILTEMNEELCYIAISAMNWKNYSVEIYGGVYLKLKHTVKLHVETPLYHYRLLPCLNGNILTILNGCAIHSYSLKEEKVELIGWQYGSLKGTYLPYINSLVSVG